MTDTRENIEGIGAILGSLSNGNLERWELCAFNNLCRDKYRRLGVEWSFSSTPLLTQEHLDMAGAWAKGSAFDSSRIFITGAARVEIQP